MIEAREAPLAADSADAEARYEAARYLARARGFHFLDAGTVAKLSVEDVVARVEAITAPPNQPDTAEANALLGTVSELSRAVIKALEIYWSLARKKTVGKSARARTSCAAGKCPQGHRQDGRSGKVKVA